MGTNWTGSFKYTTKQKNIYFTRYKYSSWAIWLYMLKKNENNSWPVKYYITFALAVLNALHVYSLLKTWAKTVMSHLFVF